MPSQDCKVEEPVYHVPDTSGWNSSTSHLMFVDNISAGSPVHSLSHGHNLSHSNMYGRPSASERWPGSGTDNLLSSLSVRQELPWTPTLHSSHPSIARRRGGDHLSPTDSWSSGLSASSGRWLGSHDGPNTHTPPYLEQRVRVRSGHPYEEAASLRRDPENLSPNYGHRFPGHCPSSRDSTAHRGLAWHQREVVTEGLKDSRSHPSHNHDTSFTPSPTLPFSNSGYNQHHQHHQHTSTHSYNSSWSSTDTTVIEAPAALQALSPQSNLTYGTTPYAASSTTMSGSGEFANVEDM